MKAKIFSVCTSAALLALSGCQSMGAAEKSTALTVLAEPSEVTHQEAIHFLRTNGKYVVELKKGELLKGLERLGDQLSVQVIIDQGTKHNALSKQARELLTPASTNRCNRGHRARGQKAPERCQRTNYALYSVPSCVSFEITRDYSIGSSDFVSTLNEILEPSRLHAGLFANDILFISSTKDYGEGFCDGRANQ